MLHRIFVQNMSDIDRQTILDLPSVEPEIIKCKDCVFKYFNTVEDDYLCGRFGTQIYQFVNDDCYCSWAERKNDE
mgnify:CR=1 FL=1